MEKDRNFAFIHTDLKMVLAFVGVRPTLSMIQSNDVEVFNKHLKIKLNRILVHKLFPSHKDGNQF